MLSLQNITFNYPQNNHFKGIRGLSFNLNEGSLLGILGKSGSGKTTLLKCIYGLEDVTKGAIYMEGEQVFGPSRNLIPGHESMKLVSQDYYVLDNHTVEENLIDKLSGYADAYKTNRTNEVLQILDLKKIKDKKACDLSAGQKQRVSIARALVDFPKLLLLDEPFTNLDTQLRDKIFTYIRKNLKENNAACVLVTHQPEEALRYATEIAIMEEGKIVQQGSPQAIYKHPSSLKIARLFGKCFDLQKSDFLSKSGLKFSEGKIRLRPENIKLAKRRDEKHIDAIVLDSLFAMDKFEIIAKTKSGEVISFYNYSEPLASEKTVFLFVDL